VRVRATCALPRRYSSFKDEVLHVFATFEMPSLLKSLKGFFHDFSWPHVQESPRRPHCYPHKWISFFPTLYDRRFPGRSIFRRMCKADLRPDCLFFITFWKRPDFRLLQTCFPPPPDLRLNFILHRHTVGPQTSPLKSSFIGRARVIVCSFQRPSLLPQSCEGLLQSGGLSLESPPSWSSVPDVG